MPLTLTISLPSNLKSFIDARTKEGNYASVSEYIRHLVRADAKVAEQERLDRMILEGLGDGVGTEVTEEFKREFIRKFEERSRKRRSAGTARGARRKVG